MSVVALPAVIANSTFLLGEMRPRMVNRGASFDNALQYCTHLRRRGIAELLLNGAPEELLQNLCWSGRAFLHVLPVVSPEERATGRQIPFYDALAAGDDDCASAIARESRATWNREEEYEEEFLYSSILMAFATRFATETDIAAWLARYSQLVEAGGEEDQRLMICQSWVRRDANALSGAIERLMRNIQRHYADLASQDAISDEEASTEGCVSVEGLALVRLARRHDIAVRQNYRLVPSLVWKAKWSLQNATDWRMEE